MRIGIVGSRRRSNLSDQRIVDKIVEQSLQRYGRSCVIVSGGCPRGADHFAEESAARFGLEMKVHPVPLDPPIQHRGDFAQRAHRRNWDIANDSDVIFCLVHPDRTGGTEGTVAYGYDLKKHVYLVDLDGGVYLSSEDQETPRWRQERNQRDLRFTDSNSIKEG